jgi:retron-type reverse transcriptase
MPDIQYGFRRGGLTIHAVKNILDKKDNTVRDQMGKFIVFYNYMKVFDLLNRHKLIMKLEGTLDVNNAMTVIIRKTLSCNTVKLTDSIIE